MRLYLDPFFKAHQCFQYVDDIRIANNFARDITRNIRAVFLGIRQAGSKLAIEKFHFGVRQVEFLGRTISSQTAKTAKGYHHKLENSKKLEQIEIPQIEKRLCSANWGSWTIIDIIFPAWPKSLTYSTNF